MKEKSKTPAKRRDRYTVQLPMTNDDFAPILGAFKAKRMNVGQVALDCILEVYRALPAHSGELAAKDDATTTEGK